MCVSHYSLCGTLKLTSKLRAQGSGVLLLPGIVWGGILTFNSRAPFGGENCSPQLFVTGFANAALPIVFIVAYAGYYAVSRQGSN